MSTVYDSGSGLVAAWHVKPGSLLAHARRVVHVQHDPVRREVGLVLLPDAGRTVREQWLDAAPTHVDGGQATRCRGARPGAALRQLTARVGLPF